MDNDRTTTMYFLSKQHVYLHRRINQDNFSSGISSSTSRWWWTSRRTLATMHGELGSSRIEENSHAATWGAGLVQEVIPQVGEMSLRRAGGICPHDGSEQGRGGPSSMPAPALRGRCASASSITDNYNINAAPSHLPQRTGFGRICDHWWGER